MLSKIRKKVKMSLPTSSIQIVLMFLVMEIKKRYKRHQIGKEAEKLSLLTVDMIAYVENLMKTIF